MELNETPVDCAAVSFRDFTGSAYVNVPRLFDDAVRGA